MFLCCDLLLSAYKMSLITSWLRSVVLLGGFRFAHFDSDRISAAFALRNLKLLLQELLPWRSTPLLRYGILLSCLAWANQSED